MSSVADQQRQFQERIARLNSSQAEARSANVASGKSPARSGGNNMRFVMVIGVLALLGGTAGYFASDFKDMMAARKAAAEAAALAEAEAVKAAEEAGKPAPLPEKIKLDSEVQN